MELQKFDIEVQREGRMKTSQFGISKGNEAHILNILRSKLYTDKILAVIREYSTNGLDAHVMNKSQSRPIEIGLPTLTSLVFTVRDFGPGLTEVQVRSIYTQYGASTKRDDNEQIGGLGIGSKSGFAYGDSFTIESITNENHLGESVNIKRIYNAYIDESGLGECSKLSQTITKEETGVMIKIPVRSQDIHNFNNTANKLFRFWKVKPKYTSSLSPIVPLPEAVVEGDHSFGKWRIYERSLISENSYTKDWIVLMGEIPYQLNMQLLRSKINIRTDFLQSLTNTNLVIEVPIGKCSIAANREGLEYDNLTATTISNIISDIEISVKKEINNKLLNCKTMLEAKMLHYKIVSDLRLTIDGKWNGKPIAYNYSNMVEIPFRVYEDSRGRIREYGSSKSLTYQVINDAVQANKKYTIIVADTTLWKVKYKYYKSNNPTNLYNYSIIVQAGTQQALDYFINNNDILTSNLFEIVYLDKVVLPKKSSVLKQANAKHSQSVFKLDFKKTSESVKSNAWDAAIITDQTVGYYIIIDKFKPVQTKFEHYPINLETMKLLNDNLTLINKQVTDLYGVKIAFKDEVSNYPNLVNFLDYYKESFIDYLDKSSFIDEYIKGKFYLENFSQEIVDFIKTLSLPNDHAFNRMCDEYVEYKKYISVYENKRNIVSIGSMLNWNLKDVDVPIINIYKELETNYPLLKRLDFDFKHKYWYKQGHYVGSPNYIAIKKYINDMDRLYKLEDFYMKNQQQNKIV